MRKRDESKEKIIREKAISIIVKDGFDGLSMQKLAKASGVSPATIYIYFEDRDDMIVQLCIEEWDKMSVATLKDFDPEMHFKEGLKIQWMNRIKYCLENPLSMHFLEQAKYSPHGEQAFLKCDQTFQKTMHKFVDNAIKRNELKMLPLEIYWSVAFSPLYTLVKFHMMGKGIPSGKKFTLDDEKIIQTLSLVTKALTP